MVSAVTGNLVLELPLEESGPQDLAGAIRQAVAAQTGTSKFCQVLLLGEVRSPDGRDSGLAALQGVTDFRCANEKPATTQTRLFLFQW